MKAKRLPRIPLTFHQWLIETGKEVYKRCGVFGSDLSDGLDYRKLYEEGTAPGTAAMIAIRYEMGIDCKDPTR